MATQPHPPFSSANEEPLYTIGVVSRMTGISVATLRAWERRYDFPETDRTKGGHRLYSERDVMRLQWVKGRIDSGMHTAQAIQALRVAEKDGAPSLPPNTFVSSGERLVDIEANGDLHLQYALRLVENLIHNDLGLADQVIAEALAVSSPEMIILQVIGQALDLIGETWEEGKIDVATEHLATNYLRQRLMMWLVSGPPPRKVAPIVLACAPGELHEGSLLMLGALLRRRRWPIAYLGQTVPLNNTAGFACEIRASFIVLVAMTESSAAALESWPTEMQSFCPPDHPDSLHNRVGFGGRVFIRKPELKDRIPGVYLGDSIQEGVETIESLIG